MKAAVLNSYRNFEWQNKPMPEYSDSEALIKITYAGICGTDMHIFKGDFDGRTVVPFIPGHEFAGIIEKTGKDVKAFNKGDKVVIDPIIWCGECPACQNGHYPACSSLKLIGIDQNGGFAQYIAVDKSMLIGAGKDTPNHHLALTEIYAIGFHACGRTKLNSSQSIAIWGAGRVGQSILQAARTITQHPIFLIDVLDSRLEIPAKAYDNIVIINPNKQNPIEVIQKETNGLGVDIAFEAVGHAVNTKFADTPVRSCIQSIKGGGQVCVLGLTDEPAPIVFKELIWKEATIIASRVSHGEFPTVIKQLESGNLKPELLVSEIIPMNEIQTAFEKIESMPEKYLKILLKA